MSDAQFFDPSSYLLEEHQSPGLQPIEPSFEVKETPPPIATRDSSLEPSDDGEEGAHGERSRDEEKPPLGDFVLVRQWAPHLPDTAKHALNRHIGPASRGQEEDPMTVAEDVQHGADNSVDQNTDSGADNDGTWDLIDVPEVIGKDTSDEVSKSKGVHSPMSRPGLKELAPASDLPPTKALDLVPPPRPPRIKTGQTEEDSLAKSPALARFTIDPADGDPSNTLPAMQMSPPRSSIAGSPEPKQTLPSLTTALSDAGTPFSAHSPSFTRASPGQMSQYGPSPHSGMSPPSLPSHPSFWRMSTREGSTSTPSDYAIVSASGSISTPASSIVLQSPAAVHPTPMASPEQTRIDGSAEQVLSPDSDDQEMNGTGPFSNSIYKCTIPSCTAAPFQTQYLLNSHMNVHSDTRPHFCPVKGCARGPGGQGFKRKNEMIRHGLVHTSPGYMCPFCPDQQHKYPRPDNLQRHVRVHHVDKDRDDPLLRDVLAQRPEGGSRGRRRRLGS